MCFICVCLSVCPLDYSKVLNRFLKKFVGGVERGPWNNWLDVGGNPSHYLDPGIF